MIFLSFSEIQGRILIITEWKNDMRYILIPLILMVSLCSQAAEMVLCEQYEDQKKKDLCMQMQQRHDFQVQKIRCSKDLKCWSKLYRKPALKACSKAVHLRAQWDATWNKLSGSSFNKVRWSRKSVGTMIYYNQQSGVRLECVFSPKQPTRARVRIVPDV